jgi:hypothetical protein
VKGSENHRCSQSENVHETSCWVKNVVVIMRAPGIGAGLADTRVPRIEPLRSKWACSSTEEGRSGGAALVTMMESTYLRHGHDPASLRSKNEDEKSRGRSTSIFLQGFSKNRKATETTSSPLRRQRILECRTFNQHFGKVRPPSSMSLESLQRVTLFSSETMATSSAQRPTIRTRKVQGTYQLSATLESDSIPDPEQRFEKARTLVLQWMNRLCIP